MATKKRIDTSNLDSLTDPLMDQTISAIVGTPATKPVSAKDSAEKKKTGPKPAEKPKPEQASEPDLSGDNRLYNYRKETVEIDGVGKVQKTLSEKGEIIGRPNVPVKEKKKPITLTLKPDLYDLVKDKAAADHRTTSEYLAMIIEDYLSKHS